MSKPTILFTPYMCGFGLYYHLTPGLEEDFPFGEDEPPYHCITLLLVCWQLAITWRGRMPNNTPQP